MGLGIWEKAWPTWHEEKIQSFEAEWAEEGIKGSEMNARSGHGMKRSREKVCSPPSSTGPKRKTDESISNSSRSDFC